MSTCVLGPLLKRERERNSGHWMTARGLSVVHFMPFLLFRQLTTRNYRRVHSTIKNWHCDAIYAYLLHINLITLKSIFSCKGPSVGRVCRLRQGRKHHQPHLRDQPVLGAASRHRMVPRNKGKRERERDYCPRVLIPTKVGPFTEAGPRPSAPTRVHVLI